MRCQRDRANEIKQQTRPGKIERMSPERGNGIIDRTVKPPIDGNGSPEKRAFSSNSYPRSDWTFLILNQELCINNTHLPTKS
jgi:hypothetical protein